MCENRHNTDEHFVFFCKILIVFVFIYPLLRYTFSKSADETIENPKNGSNAVAVRATIIKRKMEPQPSCSIAYLQIILRDICSDLIVQHTQCTPQDFNNLEKHKLPIKNNARGAPHEPRGAIVGCVAAGLLLTSLGAAFLELYKAKNQTPTKAKPLLSRKCSLADLTVLKHNRKELMRRESIMEIPGCVGKQPQFGFRPPPLTRRCSFPVGPIESFSPNSSLPYQEFNRSRDSRRLSIIDGRRGSIVIDSRRISIGSESPERRHWTKLVHRH